MIIDNMIVVAYLIVILLLGILAGRSVNTFQDYAVAKRSYSTFVIFATMAASFIGGGFTIGNAEKAFLYGMVMSFALCGFSVKELIIAKYVAPQLGRFRHAISVGDIMHEGFGQKGRILTGIFAALVCMGIVGAQVGAILYRYAQFSKPLVAEENLS